MQQFEVNFDGIVGPTHNYAGLSLGNLASFDNANATSNPKQAALQGLQKMKALSDLGLKQGVLAPQERPNIDILKRIGFSGSDSKIIEKAAAQEPEVFLACCSASSMWAANAATVSPSADTYDGKVHFTPANLTNKFHRSLEPEITGRILKATFSNEQFFAHHTHLPDNEHFGDEGAANHTRLCEEYGKSGVEIFVFGRYAFKKGMPQPVKFPARHSYEACTAVARLHGLEDRNTVYVQQAPDLIDQGIFHNDVIAVGNQNVLFFHEQAFLNKQASLDEIREKFGQAELHFVEVKTDEVSVYEAVKTYLFNTQIVTIDKDSMAIIAPTECEDSPVVSRYLSTLVQRNTPIKQVYYFDVKESMRNGGGPACLRLRVALNQTELDAVNPKTLINDSSYALLTNWVNKHYRDRLNENDLRDPQLLIECRTALDELTQLLNLGSIYAFQR